MSFVRDYLQKSRQEFFSSVEASLLLEVHVNTIRNWIRHGRMPCVFSGGGHRRIPREVLLRFGATCNQG